jgi:hypothetical protein
MLNAAPTFARVCGAWKLISVERWIKRVATNPALRVRWE